MPEGSSNISPAEADKKFQASLRDLKEAQTEDEQARQRNIEEKMLSDETDRELHGLEKNILAITLKEKHLSAGSGVDGKKVTPLTEAFDEHINPSLAFVKENRGDDPVIKNFLDTYTSFAEVYSANLEKEAIPSDPAKIHAMAGAVVAMQTVLTRARAYIENKKNDMETLSMSGPAILSEMQKTLSFGIGDKELASIAAVPAERQKLTDEISRRANDLFGTKEKPGLYRRIINVHEYLPDDQRLLELRDFSKQQADRYREALVEKPKNQWANPNVPQFGLSDDPILLGQAQDALTWMELAASTIESYAKSETQVAAYLQGKLKPVEASVAQTETSISTNPLKTEEMPSAESPFRTEQKTNRQKPAEPAARKIEMTPLPEIEPTERLTPLQIKAAEWIVANGKSVMGNDGLTDDDFGMEEGKKPRVSDEVLALFIEHSHALGEIGANLKQGDEISSLQRMLAAQKQPEPVAAEPAVGKSRGSPKPIEKPDVAGSKQSSGGKTEGMQENDIDMSAGSGMPEITLGTPEAVSSVPSGLKLEQLDDVVVKPAITRNRTDEGIRSLFERQNANQLLTADINKQFERYSAFDKKRATYGGYDEWEICRQTVKQAIVHYVEATRYGMPTDMKRRRELVESIDTMEDALDAFDEAMDGKPEKPREELVIWKPEAEKNLTWKQREANLIARQAELKDLYSEHKNAGIRSLYKQYEKAAWQCWTFYKQEGNKAYPDTKFINATLDQIASAQHNYGEKLAADAKAAEEPAKTEVASASSGASLWGMKLPSAISGLAKSTGEVSTANMKPEVKKALIDSMFDQTMSPSDIRKKLISLSKQNQLRELTDEQLYSLLYLKAHLPAVAGKDGIFNAADIPDIANSIYNDLRSRPWELYNKIMAEKRYHPAGKESMGLRRALDLQPDPYNPYEQQFSKGLRMERGLIGRFLLRISGKSGELQNGKYQIAAGRQSLPGQVIQGIADNFRNSLRGARVIEGWNARDTGHEPVSEAQMREMEKHTAKLREISRAALQDVREATGADIESYSPSGLSYGTIDWMLDAHSRPEGRTGSPPESAFFIERKGGVPANAVAQQSSAPSTVSQQPAAEKKAVIQNVNAIPGVSVYPAQREIRVPVNESFTITYNPNPSNIPPTHLKPDRVASLQGIALDARRYSDLWVLQIRPGYEKSVIVTRDSDGSAISLESVQQTRNAVAPSPEGIVPADETASVEPTLLQPTSIEKIRDGNIIEIRSENQLNQILKDSDVPVIIDFTAIWCGPCQQMKPFLESVARERKNDVTVVSIDADQFRYLADRYRASRYPTLVVYNAGNEERRREGALLSNQSIVSLFDDLLKGKKIASNE